ncbi:MAG: 3-hydroxyacyl-CoA dehydrogenase, partial [Pseudomonadota bacterium]
AADASVAGLAKDKGARNSRANNKPGGTAVKDPLSADYVVGVAGAGAMGQGIAQVSAQGGMRVLIFDAREGGAEAAKIAIAGRINRLVEKGRMGAGDAEAAIGRIEPAESLADLAPCDTVVEAVFEDIDVKHQLFRDLEAVVSPDCILASNTSSIPIASIARACERRDRVAGLHFFNPVPLMKLVEVIRAAETSDPVIAALMHLGRRMTRVPVEVKDAPGFLVNMGGRAYTTEALRIVHEGVATPAQVDAIMRDCWGFRMGPFELMDLTGIDVNYPVSQIIYEGYNHDPRLKTAPNHKAMYDAGLFGRKTGQGWFSYDKGQPLERPSPDFVTNATPISTVTLRNPSKDLRDLLAECGFTEGDGPIIDGPDAYDATAAAAMSEPDQDISAVVCVDTLGDTSKRVTMMTPPGVNPDIVDGVAATFIAAGRSVTLIKDSVGFVGPRMVAMVANLGCYMAEVGLATPEDIDTAMQLGLNYPKGSIALGESLGAPLCHAILAGLREVSGDDRYRPTPWLRRRAALGLSLYTPS